jgi:crotonobetainyl-CoA:carnitine CoA-transferase CaiB-like acyl-CoA transferase
MAESPGQQQEATPSGPLHGVRVVDLSRLVAGNMLTLQLADFGAEVIKIEDPVKGDPLRAWRVNDISIHWKTYARNKKSLALDLRNERCRAILLELIATADVLIENFRPGGLENMGFSPETLLARNAGLVVVRISGWGQTGPYRERPGFGTLVEGMSGFAARNGFPDRPPLLPPASLADMIAGIYGFGAALVALRHREVNGGTGQVIDLPLLDPLFSVLGPEAGIYQLTGDVRPRTGSRSMTGSPRNTFRTSDDRWIAISASMQGVTERLFKAIGRPDMISDPRFLTNSDRVKNADACEQPIAEFIERRTFAEVMKVFEEAEVTAAPIYDIDQFIRDPHVKARAIVVEVPDNELGSVLMHNVVPRLEGTPGHIRSAAPDLGQHTHSILRSLGISENELTALYDAGAISQSPTS